MAVEVNNAVELLQLRHFETNKWVQGVILLQVEGGFGVKFVPAQFEKINQLVQGVQSLKDSLTQSLNHNTEENGAILAQIKEIEDAINSAVDKSQKIVDLTTAVNQMRQASSETLAANQNLLQSSNRISSLLQQVHAELKDINNLTSDDQSSSTLDNILREVQQCLQNLKINKANNYFNQVVALVPNTVKTVSLPENTETLVFFGRKNLSTDESYDIHYSLNDDGIQGENYATLLAYNEYNKSNLNFNGKTLHLRCEEAITVEVTTYFCTLV